MATQLKVDVDIEAAALALRELHDCEFTTRMTVALAGVLASKSEASRYRQVTLPTRPNLRAEENIVLLNRILARETDCAKRAYRALQDHVFGVYGGRHLILVENAKVPVYQLIERR